MDETSPGRRFLRKSVSVCADELPLVCTARTSEQHSGMLVVDRETMCVSVCVRHVKCRQKVWWKAVKFVERVLAGPLADFLAQPWG